MNTNYLQIPMTTRVCSGRLETYMVITPPKQREYTPKYFGWDHILAKQMIIDCPQSTVMV